MGGGNRIFQLIRRAAMPALALIVVGTFAGHAVAGPNGILAWGGYHRALKERQAELAQIEREPPQAKRYKASKDDLLKLYREMLLIRRFEERAGQLYGLGLIGGFCHLYIGQEAVAVGLQSALTGGKDSVITGYRDHGHMLAYGIDPKVIMAELTGRAAGISKGKGGSMPMFR